MELELRLPPDDAARLPRLPLLSAAGKLRGQAVRIVWHDSPDAALAGEGLCLAQERGVWHLERLVPGTAIWPPGAPAPIQSHAATPDGLAHVMPPTLAAVAAFAGRRTGFEVETDHGPVTLWMWRGALRAVEAERPACRLHLSGADAALRSVALALADALPVDVPRATLAAEGLAAARGLPPPARQLGAPALPDGLDIADSFASVLGHLTDVILHFAPAAAADAEGPEPVHQMRVAVRRLRSAITMFRHALDCPELAAAAADLKVLGARLAPTRDWDVFLGETAPPVSAAFPAEHRLARLLAAAERQRKACHAALRAYLEGDAWRRLGIELAWLAGARSWHPVPPDGEPIPPIEGLAAELLDKRLRKLLRAGDEIETLDAAGLHAVRLRAKRARYAAEVFGPLYPAKAARRFTERLGTLQDRLGVMNDGTTAAKLLAELGPRHAFAAGLVLGFIGADAAKLRPKVLRSWEKVRRTPAFWEQS
ncbi:MAG TPA: CHAD domain-containing protein [Acetobacteraceae bacterium]|jgi:CHAD domain-containing protein